MRHISDFSTLFRHCALLALTAGLLPLQAQDRERETPASSMIRVRSLDANSLSSPEYSFNLRGRSTTRDGRRNWLVLEAEFDTAPRWIDEVTFTFYVVLEGRPEDLPEGARERNLFSGTVTYVNVKRGNRQLAQMFLDPNTFERFGRATFSAVVVTIGGQNAAVVANPSASAASEWWTRETPNEIPLLPKNETPYAFVEHDHTPTIQP